MIEEWAESPFTLHDSQGEPFAARRPDGSYLHAALDYPVAFAWDDFTASKLEWEVVWHGGRRRGDWSRTKGELLGDYARLAEHFRWVGIPGPVPKIASSIWFALRRRRVDPEV